jgi:hypothetical protein
MCDFLVVVEKSAFCAYGTFLESFISAHETLDLHFTCCIYMFVKCTVSIHTPKSILCRSNFGGDWGCLYQLCTSGFGDFLLFFLADSLQLY